MTNFVFRIRLRDPLSNEDAERVSSPSRRKWPSRKGHGATSSASSGRLLRSLMPYSALSVRSSASASSPLPWKTSSCPWLTSLNERVGLVNRFRCSSAVSAARETFLSQSLATCEARFGTGRMSPPGSRAQQAGESRSRTGLGRSLPSTAPSPTVCSLASAQRISNGSTASLGRDSASPAAQCWWSRPAGGRTRQSADAVCPGIVSWHRRCRGQTVEGFTSRRAGVDTNRTRDIGKEWMLAVWGGH